MIFLRFKNFVRDKLNIQKGTRLFAVLDRIYRFINNCTRVKGPLGTLPDFLILGVQKSGTTSIFDWLIQHPNIYSSTKKDIHYFDCNYTHKLSWYRSFFPLRFSRWFVNRILKQPFLTGEASTSYSFYHFRTAKRIKRMNPNMKLIMVVRNPIERTYSLYKHLIENGREKRTFENAIDQEEKTIGDEQEKVQRYPNYVGFNHYYFSYKLRGRYYDQLKSFMDLFPNEQIKVISFEDFFSDPQQGCNELFDFLEVPRHRLKRYSKLNISKTKKRMKPETRKKLKDYFNKENEKLFKLIGKRFDWE